MTVISERERVKEKIVKLLNVTRDRGASENEAMTAAERAAELMTHFDIEASELSIRSTRSIEKTAKKRRYGSRQIATRCAYWVAQICDCMTWYYPDRHVFFGLPHDAEIAAHLFDTISNCILAEAGIYKATADFAAAANLARGEYGVNARAVVGEFITGIEDRICARLRTLREDKERTVQEATGRSLVIVKGEQVKKDFEALEVKLRPGRLTRRYIWSTAAYRNGAAAGDRIPLSRGVKSEGPTGRLK
jgi:hypothetical protein